MGSAKSPIAIGMSGGTDSSMAAYLLSEAGHEVIGFTLRLWPEASPKSSDGHVANARQVADKLGIRHDVVDMHDLFERTVVTPFVEAYRRAETPSPCIRCNAAIKFGALLDLALAAGCGRLATGHYARTEVRADGTTALLRARDETKDQSYFLFCLRRRQLGRVCFPLGDLAKEQVRKQALKLGLIPHEHGESQDLCFVPNGDYADFITHRHPELRRPGPITDTHGKVLGQHSGYFCFTVGQRRGLGLGAGPWYVKELIPAENRVIVGRASDLAGTQVAISGTTWLCDGESLGSTISACAQLRYNMDPTPCQVRIRDAGSALIEFSRPVQAITPGQAAVLYDGERVLGGGWICREI